MEENLYQCKECGLHYNDKTTAVKCEAWCKERKSCNLEITKHSEENKILELNRRSEEYLNNWKRAQADFENYKKGEVERAGMVIQYAREDMILKILPILDSLYYATKHIQDKGLEQIQKQAEELLKHEGVEEIETVGKQFNPETMEAVAEAESTDKGSAEGGDAGIIVEELQKGYKMGEKVIRPAKVKVSK